MLNKEDLNQLILKAQAGDKEALDLAFKRSIKLVYMVANKKNIKSKSDDYESVLQEGMVGLLIAIKRFDVNKGFAFSSFASKVIEIRMTLYISRGYAHYKAARITRLPYTRLAMIHNFKEQFETDHRRQPTIKEISEGLNLSMECVSKLLLFNEYPTSLESRPTEGESTDFARELKDIIEDEAYKPFNENRLVSKILIKQYWGILSRREELVLRLRYFKGLTNIEIAEMMGRTPEWVSCLRSRGLKRLRKAIEGDE